MQDDHKEGYVPRQREVLDRLVAEKKGIGAVGFSSKTVAGKGEYSAGEEAESLRHADALGS